MKKLEFDDKTKTEMVRAARAALDPLEQSDFWQQVIARLDQNEAARRPKIEKRGLTSAA